MPTTITGSRENGRKPESQVCIGMLLQYYHWINSLALPVFIGAFDIALLIQ